MKTKITWITVIISLLQGYDQTNTFFEQKRLYEYLKENIDDKIRPVLNQSDPVEVHIEVYLSAILGLNERDQVLETSISLACRWNYETLAWNKSEYGGINFVNLSPLDSWIPFLSVGNSVDSLFLTENKDQNMITVESNGDAIWYTGGTVRTSCFIDVTKYPFDSQKCRINLRTASSDREMTLIAAREKVVTAVYEDNGEWTLKDSYVRKGTVSSYTSFIEVQITLKRNSIFYSLNVIVPVALLSFMTVLCFKVPPACGERLSYNIALLLTFFVLFNGINESMPKVSTHVSYLQVYVIYQLIVAVFVTALSVMLVNIQKTQKSGLRIIAKFVYQCCYTKVKKTTGIKSINADEETEAESPQTQSTIEPIDMLDGEKVITKFDDTLFWVFFCIAILSTVIFIVAVSF